MTALLTEVHDHVLVVTLNRPEVRNAIDRALGVEIATTMDAVDRDDSIRACVLTGAGGTFSTGTDLNAHRRGESMVVEPRGFYGLLGRPPRVPLIAAVEGHAVGGGFEVVLACDLIVASRDAIFGLPEVTHGVFPAGGAQRLPLRMPYHHAMELALTGSFVGAERANALGLVNRLVEPGQALEAALELAAEISRNAPIAVRAAKAAIADAAYHGSETAAWTRQLELNEAVLASEDSREGVAAFLDKRAARWRGA